jgi:hypothetical protein
MTPVLEVSVLSRRITASVALGALVLLTSTLHAQANPTWGIQPVGASGVILGHNATSIALDPQGLPRISFFEGQNRDLLYSEKNGGRWTTTVLDTTGDRGRWSSLAIDGQGEPHITYYDFLEPDLISPTGGLIYARRSAGAWTFQVVDSVGTVGEYTSLVLDAQGNPHVSYYDNSNGDLKYAFKSGGVWTKETVESSGNVGTYTSLALDSQGNPHIAYADLTLFRVRYASKSGGTWTFETVSGVTPVIPSTISLDLDSQDRPHVAYYDQTVDKTRYGHKPSTSWEHGIATALGAELRGSFISLKVDSQDIPHMSFFTTQFGQPQVFHASKSGSGGTYWVPQLVQNTPGPWTSLVLDGIDAPHISYHTTASNSVQYAVFTDNTSDAGDLDRVSLLTLDAWPNPVRNGTTLVLRSPRTVPLQLAILDARGRVVRNLVHRELPPGTHAFAWDGRDDAGNRVSAGVYFAVTRPDWLATSRKLVVVR